MKLIKNNPIKVLLFAALCLCLQAVMVTAQDGAGAESIISVTQGEQNDGNNVSPDRSNPNNALGQVNDPAENVDEAPWFSLGFPRNGVSGTITLGFRCRIVNGDGPDVSIFENTTISGYPLERARIEALDPNTGMFVEIGFAGNEQQPMITRTDLDLGSLPYTLQIRVTDVTDRTLHVFDADGFDLNAVQAIHGDCGTMPSVGQFVIGDLVPINQGNTVYFWGSQWRQNNPISGGTAPAAFKGFQDSPEMISCGDTWSSRPGNSTPPPDTVPDILDVIVSSQVTKSGPIISGNIEKIIRIQTLPGYQGNPGHPGRGTVIEVVCDSTRPTSKKAFQGSVFLQ